MCCDDGYAERLDRQQLSETGLDLFCCGHRVRLRPSLAAHRKKADQRKGERPDQCGFFPHRAAPAPGGALEALVGACQISCLSGSFEPPVGLQIVMFHDVTIMAFMNTKWLLRDVTFSLFFDRAIDESLSVSLRSAPEDADVRDAKARAEERRVAPFVECV
jgi:hypothetical protein